MSAAIECSKYWLVSSEAQAQALSDMAELIPALVLAESCNDTVACGDYVRTSRFSTQPAAIRCTEKACWDVVSSTIRESIAPSFDAVRNSVNENFYEPHAYLGGLCLSQAKAAVAATQSLPIGSDEHVDSSLKTAQEWNIFRRIRHAMLLEYMGHAAVAFMLEAQKQLSAWNMAFELISSDTMSELSQPKAKSKTLRCPCAQELRQAVLDETSEMDAQLNRLKQQ